ncbi:carbohydrate-binding protein [Aquirufa rosea]|uniref:Carbohydrate-binding protein n=1 Tax=Aquirufa rosea TaxID=2509241 RepID=A0A4Q1BX24_9BACT|nr:carbohydrate-binding protein [Aquirufa rosea]RXK46561.1 carbohydrate-binding protein [Aquirufa rosea]
MLHAICLATLLLGGVESPLLMPEAKQNTSKQFKPNRPALIKKNASATYVLAASAGKAIGPNIKYMPEYQAFGWFTSKDRVEWEVEIQKTGNYQVEIDYSVDNTEAGKEFILLANGTQLVGKVPSSGSWETYRVIKPGKIKLQAGVQKIVFKSKTWFKDGGAILDLRGITLR